MRNHPYLLALLALALSVAPAGCGDSGPKNENAGFDFDHQKAAMREAHKGDKKPIVPPDPMAR